MLRQRPGSSPRVARSTPPAPGSLRVERPTPPHVPHRPEIRRRDQLSIRLRKAASAGYPVPGTLRALSEAEGCHDTSSTPSCALQERPCSSRCGTTLPTVELRELQRSTGRDRTRQE